MSQTSEDILAHYGVKGMKWGVRKSEGPPSRKAVIATKSAQQLAVIGSIQAGRILGSSAGTVIGGPGIGTMVGAHAGGYAGGKVASKAIYGDMKQKIADARKDVDAFMPDRNPNYKPGSAKNDISTWGPDGAQRINRSMNQGMKLKDARASERKLNNTVALITLGTTLAGALTYGAAKYAKSPEGSTKLHNFATQKGDARRARGTARAAASAARRNAKPAGLSALKVAKRSRNGVYNVTSMK